MSVLLKLINSGELDLSTSSKFLTYYNNPNSYCKHIIELELNNGHYNDNNFLNIFKNRDAVVIDAGANIGLFSLYIHNATSKIYAVEPTAEHISTLQDICRVNNITNIESHQIAFNNYNGFCCFTIDESNTTTNRVSNNGSFVKCSTVYNFISQIAEKKVDLLKLDIEGGEESVVLDDPTFDRCADLCDNIYIEIHPSPRCNTDTISQKLRSLGYNIKLMNSENLNNNLNLLAFK